MRFAFVAAGMCLVLSGCLTPATPPPITATRATGVTPSVTPRSTAPAEPISLDTSEPIRLTQVQVAIPRGTPVGQTRFVPMMCGDFSISITWGSGRFGSESIEFPDNFHRIMKQHGYKVLGDPTALFRDDEQRERATYQVGAQVTGLHLELCPRTHWFDGRSLGTYRGSSSVQVDWQVFEPLGRKIVLRKTTYGKFATDADLGGGAGLFVQHAFADAVDALAADNQFRALVATRPDSRTTVASRVPGDAIPLQRLTLFKSRISDQIDRIRAAAVTIQTESGHGSGFFVAQNGMVLTNAHVVGDAKFVKVVLVTGRSVLGEVLRVHRERDVALVLAEGDGYQALPIRETPAAIAEDVYAIGTPLERRYFGTVTRGIVSKYLTNGRRLEDIQADVDIQGGNSGGPLLDANGNVVAISYAGIGPGKMSIGVNFFIPILDALDKLNVNLSDRVPVAALER